MNIHTHTRTHTHTRVHTHVYTCTRVHMHIHTHTQVNKLVRCLTLLKEYVMECDEEYSEERGIPPHGRSVLQDVN